VFEGEGRALRYPITFRDKDCKTVNVPRVTHFTLIQLSPRAGTVGRVHPLGDHALELDLAGVLEHDLAFLREVITLEDRLADIADELG